MTAPLPALPPDVVVVDVESSGGCSSMEGLSAEEPTLGVEPTFGAPLTGEPVSPVTFPPQAASAKQANKTI